MKKKRKLTDRDPSDQDRPIAPNLWDFFLITTFSYLSFIHRGTALGWFLAVVALFLLYICIVAITTGGTIVRRD